MRRKQKQSQTSAPKSKTVPKAQKRKKTSNLGSKLIRLWSSLQLVFYGLIFVLLIGFLTNKLLLLREASLYKPLGKILEIDGKQVELWCLGPTTSNHVIVIEQAAGATFLHTSELATQLSSHTRTCSYNRPGRMFTPSAGQTNASVLLSHLDRVLSSSGEKGPFVLVGHQFGSLLATAYALQNAPKVKGLLLLDPLGPSNLTSDSILSQFLHSNNLMEILSLTGAFRLLQLWRSDLFGINHVPPEYRELYKYYLNQPTGARSKIEELELSQSLIQIIKNATDQGEVENFPPVELILPSLAKGEIVHILRHFSDQTIVKTFGDVDGNFPYEKPKETEALIVEFLGKLQ